QKIIEGYPDGTFRPNNLVTRAQVAVLLTRGLNLDTKNVNNPNYKDVPTTHHNYKEIAAAQNANIFIKAENFNPNGKMTRGNMAIVLQRAFKLKTGENPLIFHDVSSSMSNYLAIMAISSNNITRGYSDQTFKPATQLTRAHFSAFLARAMTLTSPNLLKDKDYVYTYRYQSDLNKQSLLLESRFLQMNEGNQVWQVKNNTNSISFDNEILTQNKFDYAQGSINGSHYDMILTMPIRIGIMRHEYEDEIGLAVGYRLTIKDTNAMVQAGGVTYNNVIVVEQMYTHDGSINTHYFAPNIGLVKKVEQKGGIVLELMKRTAR
ncbi:MAG: S-layer homology domain-containing protein, partial [Lysinibacillus sp.]